ncbi:hypothetical protein SAMN05660836_01554 [Thermodesulforhabdus norvegica]|uniref:Uncharacterized protein n=1 Tax=Thermodesulforhabdus norvegica TaxID=39841 RepID=A0A1I4TW25_9BACT|nr:hypothetical protein SAMN05660836_01554 [Thermodesulforhabdus norvegica]
MDHFPVQTKGFILCYNYGFQARKQNGLGILGPDPRGGRGQEGFFLPVREMIYFKIGGEDEDLRSLY